MSRAGRPNSLNSFYFIFLIAVEFVIGMELYFAGAYKNKMNSSKYASIPQFPPAKRLTPDRVVHASNYS